MVRTNMRDRRRVVVTGIGAITPVGLTAAESWDAVIAGTSGIGPITHFDTTEFDVKIAGEVKGFDPEAHLARKQVRRLDRFCHLALAAAIEAMGDAGLEMAREDGDRIGVVVGSGIGGIGTLSTGIAVMNEFGPSRVGPCVIPALLVDTVSGVIAMQFGAKGPNHSIVSACTSSAHAIGNAMEIICRGDADVMIAGGAEAAVVPVGIAGFQSMRALSRRNDDPTGASRPFDAERDGFVIAEGAAILILESREHAIRRGAHILGEILGYGNAADAFDMVHPAPDGEGLARAIQAALCEARLRPEEIGYINAHGTSTDLNDAHETMAIKRVFGAHAPPVSSTKSMTGHLLGASGALEAIFSLLALRDQVLPPTINQQHPDPHCDLDYVPNRARPANIRYVLSNNSAFGGHNTGLIFGAAA